MADTRTLNNSTELYRQILCLLVEAAPIVTDTEILDLSTEFPDSSVDL